MNIDICKLELQNIDLKPRDSEKIRGYLGNKYIENDILHNHNHLYIDIQWYNIKL